jgi:predicted ribosomally synthesized peptide with nif11-like leader
MSKQAVEGFMKRLDADKGLQTRLRTGAKGTLDPVASVEAGRKLGFEFTAQEFTHVQEAMLSDEQLEAVSGGMGVMKKAARKR